MEMTLTSCLWAAHSAAGHLLVLFAGAWVFVGIVIALVATHNERPVSGQKE